MRLYLAGPMRGLPLFNFPAFDEATDRLRKQGHEVFSPAEQDREAGQDGNKSPETIAHYMAINLPEVCKADAVAVLPGWENSQGCRIELTVASEIGKKILDAQTLQPMFHPFVVMRVKKIYE